MNRWLDIRTVLVAVAFLAIGFLIADRMVPAHAAPQAAAASAPAAASFAGKDGALTIHDGRQWWLFIVRDEQVYRVPVGERLSPTRPWTTLTSN